MKLSITQFAVMTGLAGGATCQEIAMQLDCSRHMIRHHVSRACAGNGYRTCDQLMFNFGHWLAGREEHNAQRYA